jgi:hypothetical protein
LPNELLNFKLGSTFLSLKSGLFRVGRICPPLLFELM